MQALVGTMALRERLNAGEERKRRPVAGVVVVGMVVDVFGVVAY